MLCGCITGPTPKEIKQAEIQYDLGLNDFRAGKLTVALKSFMDAVELNPEFPQAHNALGLTYFMLGNHAKALQHFEQALKQKPDYSGVLNNMSRVYISQGKYRKAIPLLKKALDDVFLKERYLAESNLGWALFNIGEEEQGFKHVRNALAQNDKYCVGYEYLGLMHKARKDFDESVRNLVELTTLCPGYLVGHQHLGKLYLMVGEIEKGCAELATCRAPSRMTEVGRECDRLFRKSCPEPPAEGADSSQ
jgi:Tfp pilus assembly protein PilF